MAVSACGEFLGEVFVDEDGRYVGDFAIGDGPGGPFGFVCCMSFCDPMSFFACFRSFSRSYKCECGFPYTAIGVPFAFGVGNAYTVDDPSGPPGLEAIPAMRVDLPGSPDCYLGWAGAQVIDDVTGAWNYGTLDGSTGWDPAADETWLFSCWARHADATPIDGATLSFAVAPNGFGPGAPTVDALDLTTDWQFFSTTFNGGFFPSSSFYWPLIHFAGAIENVGADHCDFFGTRIDINTYQPKGSVLIKCAHLYPPITPGGNWIDSFHGHG